MEMLICRTCLKVNLIKTNCVNIFYKNEENKLVVRDMLENFIPEMDLEIFKGETVICKDCFELLLKSYAFKNVCLQTEEKIYDYLNKHNIQLGEKINLNELVDGERFKTECNVLEDNSSDSNSTDTNLQEAPSRKRKRQIPKSDYNSLKRSYTCDLCEYKAYRLDLLETHKKKHAKNQLKPKEYKCAHCLYSTTRKRALERHLFTHNGESAHLCQICNKTFAEKYQLKLHSITHTGQDLPHKCPECGKGYLTKSYLKQHLDTRHVSKTHNCDKCDQKCTHTSRLYKCQFCDASFSDRRGLDAHKFTHTGGELPFKCPKCSFRTAWKGNLKKHARNKH